MKNKKTDSDVVHNQHTNRTVVRNAAAKSQGKKYSSWQSPALRLPIKGAGLSCAILEERALLPIRTVAKTA